jgi:hypothetical protein
VIVVKVEMWPGGDAEKAEPLGIVAIANRGHVGEDSDLCKYDVQMHRPRTDRKPVLGHFTHWRRRGWVRCVRLALEAVEHGTSR